MPALTRVVSRIKVLARLDIADRTRPQDGRACLEAGGRTFDLRIVEVALATPELPDPFAKDASSSALQAAAVTTGMRTLREAKRRAHR